MKSYLTKIALVAIAVMMVISMTVVGASAADAETLVYAGEEDAVAFLVRALDAAEESDVTIDLQADLVFNADADYASTAIKATSGEIPENTITVTSTTGNGIVMGTHSPNVVLYGKFVFKDITYGATAQNVNGNGLIFPDGAHGTFGYESGSTWAGMTKGTAKANLGGNVTVYSGEYCVIAGNLYKSATTINAPAVTVRGNTKADKIYGGSYNGNSGKVRGVSTLNVLDSAYATDIGGGGYSGGTDSTQGVVAVIDTDSTQTIERCIVGMSGSYAGTATFKMTIKNGVFKYIGGARGIAAAFTSNAGYTTDLTIEGGTVTTNVYNGVYATSDSQNKTIAGTYNLKILGGTFNGGTYNGCLVNKGKDAAVKITATFNMTIGDEDAATAPVFNAGVYGSHAVLGSEPEIANIGGQNNVDIYEGTFSSSFFGGCYLVKNANFTNNVDIEIFGGSFASAIYGGSNLHEDGDEAANYGATTKFVIEGGEFAKTSYAGSYFDYVGTAAEYAKHTGNNEVIIKGGTFKENFLGGSYFVKSQYGEHSGEVTMTLQGTEGKTIKAYQYFAAGSQLNSSAIHTGKTTLYVKDIVTSNAVAGKTINLVRYDTTKSMYLFGGSMIDASTYGVKTWMIGNSELVIRRSVLDGSWLTANGGTRMDGHKNVRTEGNSILTIDANTGLVYDEETEKYVEKEGQGGFNYLNIDLYGGCWLNGYYSTAKYSQAMQTGDAKVVLNAPADRVDGDLSRQLTLGRNVYGGSYYSNNMRHWTYGDSATYINGYVDKINSAIIFGGDNYCSGRTLLDGPDTSYYGDSRIANAKVVIDGTFEGDVYGGARNPRNAAVTYELNTGIILKSGGVTGTMYLGSMNASNATSYPDAVHTYKGVVLFELWKNAGCSDGMQIIFGTDERSVFDSTVKKTFKVIGNFSDKDNTSGANGSYDFYTNEQFNFFDYIQEYGGVALRKAVYNEETGVYDNSNTSAYGSGFERIEYRKLIKICTSTSTKNDPVQLPFVAGTTFEELLQGSMIFNGYDPNLTQTVSNNIASYANITLVNELSESPNVYRFFTVTPDGKKGEEMTVIGAGTNKYYVQVGNYTSAVTTVGNAAIEETENIIKSDENYIGTGFSVRTGANLGFRYRAKIDKTFFETYTANVTEATGFKLAELGIKASATINGNPWSVNATAWKNGALVSNIGGGAWHEDENDADSYYFGAVITGFGSAADRVSQEFTFSVYAVYEDINGQLTEVVVGEAATSSLYETAQKLATLPEYAEWYTEYKADIDAILAIVENA